MVSSACARASILEVGTPTAHEDGSHSHIQTYRTYGTRTHAHHAYSMRFIFRGSGCCKRHGVRSLACPMTTDSLRHGNQGIPLRCHPANNTSLAPSAFSSFVRVRVMRRGASDAAMRTLASHRHMTSVRARPQQNYRGRLLTASGHGVCIGDPPTSHVAQ